MLSCTNSRAGRRRQRRGYEPCFRAAATVTMVAPKVGFASPAAREVVGRVVVVDIGVPRGLIPGRPSAGAGLDS